MLAVPTPFYRAAAEPLLEKYLYPTLNTMLGVIKKYFSFFRGGDGKKHFIQLKN